ncbi:MAG: hypothetical protein IJB33_06830 [Akkermansia sp.]|nr:hypothetical protein [Akkermansia sp.]
MPHRSPLLLLVLLLSLTCSAVGAPLRVLFIGNSYTYCNDLPGLVQAMADEKKVPMQVDSHTAGAMSLQGFLNTPQHARARKLLANGGYDWVILQDQSQTPAYNPDNTLTAVKQWADLASAKGTKVMLFLTWAHAAEMNGKIRLQTAMQEATSRTYCEAAVRNNTEVAPVGEAWQLWYSRKLGKQLHTDDLSHPTEAGSYLAACVIYSALTGTAPTKLPTRFKSRRMRLSATQARELQAAAAAALRQFTPAGHLRKLAAIDEARPDAVEAKARLRRGMSRQELSEALGRPTAVYTEKGGRCTVQYLLRNRGELTAYCNPGGIVESVSMTSPGAVVDIIDLSTL